MIVVHHLEKSRSHRILWTLEELGVEYTLKNYPRDPKTNLAPKSLKAVHPLGKSPVISDGDVVIAESGAIIEYLVETYGQGQYQPEAGTEAYRRYRYWMHAAEGSIMPLLVMKLVFHRTTEAPVPFFIRPVTKTVAKTVGRSYIDPSIHNHLKLIESELAKSAYFAGDKLTGADFQMSFVVEGLASRSDLSHYPHTQTYLQNLQARPAYQKAVEKGGPVIM